MNDQPDSGGGLPRSGRGLRRSGRGLLAELLVVALGVFAALLAEDWRQTANERAEERRVLAALRTEFAESRVRLDRRMDIYSRRQQSQLAILELIRGAPTPNADSLDALFRWSIRLGSYDPPTGALGSTIASGDLQLIRDLDLRSALAQWPSSLEDYNRSEDVYQDLILDHYRPRLRETVGLPSGMAENRLPPNSTPVRLGDALSDPVIEQVLRELAGYSALLLFETGTGNRLGELLKDIQARLGAGPGRAP